MDFTCRFNHEIREFSKKQREKKVSPGFTVIWAAERNRQTVEYVGIIENHGKNIGKTWQSTIIYHQFWPAIGSCKYGPNHFVDHPPNQGCVLAGRGSGFSCKRRHKGNDSRPGHSAKDHNSCLFCNIERNMSNTLKKSYIVYLIVIIYRLFWLFNMYIQARPSPGTTYDGVGVGLDVNVHVKLQKQLMLRTRGVGWGGVGCQRSCEVAGAVDATHMRGGVGGGWGWMLTFMWSCKSSWCCWWWWWWCCCSSWWWWWWWWWSRKWWWWWWWWWWWP